MATRAKPLVVVPPSRPATNSLADVDIRPAKPPVPIRSPWAWLSPLLVALVVAALAAVLWRYWRKRKAAATPEVVIPPHITARDRLRAALALLGQPEPFCVAVSQIIRLYLEQRFQLKAPVRTTEEFLEDLHVRIWDMSNLQELTTETRDGFLDELQSSDSLNLAQRRSLADFLTRCDLVKFARYEPAEEELRGLYNAAIRLVEETEPGSWAPGPEPATPAAPPPEVGSPS